MSVPTRRPPSAIEAILQGRPPADLAGRPALWILACGMGYGAVMGSYGGIAGDRIWQVVYSAVKVPLLLLATFALGVPSYFVLNTLMGVRSDFARALRALASAQAALAIVLGALAPFTAFWYASTAAYHPAILFNGLMFGAASLGAQLVLRRAYRPLIAGDPRHRGLLRAWLVLYAFVGIQMGWILRPFVGNPDQPVRFFRGGEWENAYEVVAKMIWGVVAG